MTQAFALAEVHAQTLPNPAKVRVPLTAAGKRAKGQQAERELSKLLNDALGFAHDDPRAFLRNLEQPRGGGCDLISPAFPALAIEVKRWEKLYLAKWMLQAVSQAYKGSTPVLAYRKSRCPWSFCIPLAAIAQIPDGAEAPPQSLIAQLDLDGFLWWLRTQQTQA